MTIDRYVKIAEALLSGVKTYLLYGYTIINRGYGVSIVTDEVGDKVWRSDGRICPLSTLIDGKPATSISELDSIQEELAWAVDSPISREFLIGFISGVDAKKIPTNQPSSPSLDFNCGYRLGWDFKIEMIKGKA